MTVNQKRARDLAIQILRDEGFAERLQELDWTLLLLAARMYNSATSPAKLAARVLADYREGIGYFVAPDACGQSFQWLDLETAERALIGCDNVLPL
ncbi:MAG TPA: hypothetical protein VFE47_06495 [Tepidisphaeraceae bacterium]|nr:hypothetical protein [Tepidisphaeraceae bacterium]